MKISEARRIAKSVSKKDWSDNERRSAFKLLSRSSILKDEYWAEKIWDYFAKVGIEGR